MAEVPENQASVNPHDAVTLAASRYWQERAQGRRVSIDDVLDTPANAPGYLMTRATAIGLIARQAAQHADAVIADSSERPTVVFPSGGEGGLGGSIGGPGGLGSGPLPQVEGYDLVACLGRGGMGAVFEGYQQSTGRRVAIKFMLEGFDRSESLRKRFEREVEVVARLNHPGIVSVVDSGVRRGRYYYVMEYVAGRSLEIALRPGECEPRKAIELVAQVCDAIDYAHQHGVLHRDLKPSNIIVDDQGLPRLLDFGLAKTFDPGADGVRPLERNLTVSGPDQLLGTIGYMSPEQAAGKHDELSVRTDIYSLGAIAYELLTARLPCLLDGSLREVLSRIAEDDPPAPSSLRRKLGRSGSRSASAVDADAVLLKALEKSPERRYATAGELAADLRRVLAGEPVSARRIGVAGRLWRWVNRHRAISAVIASAILALAAVSSFLVLRIVEERDLARQNFSLLRGILESANPASGGKMTVAQLLDGASTALDASPPEQPLAEAEIRELLGNVYTKDGEYEKAIVHLGRTVQILESQPGSSRSRDLADALHKLGVAYWWSGDYAKAESVYQRSLDIRRHLHKGDDAEVALSLTHLAACRLRLGKLEESRELYQQALEIRQRLYRGVNGGDHEEIAQALNALAKCYLEGQQYARAEDLFRQALGMIRRLRGDSFEGTAATSQNLADCLLRQCEAAVLAGTAPEPGIANAAAEAMARALAIRKAIYPDGHHLVAASMIGLSRAELAIGNPERALELAESGLKMYRDKRRSDHPEYAEALRARAAAHLAMGEDLQALGQLEEALGVAEAARPPAPGQVTRIQWELARVLLRSGDRARGERLLVEAFEAFRSMGVARMAESRRAAIDLVEHYSAGPHADLAEPYRVFLSANP